RRQIHTPGDRSRGPGARGRPTEQRRIRVGSEENRRRRQPTRRNDMPVATRRELLEAGVHFGHQTRRWNPKMQRYLYGERSGIYIVDLEKTLSGLQEAYDFVRD